MLFHEYYNEPVLNKKYHILLIPYIFIYVRIRIFNANPMVLFSLKSSENWQSYSMITINQPYPARFGSSKNGNYIQHYPLPSTHSCLHPTYITRCIVTYIPQLVIYPFFSMKNRAHWAQQHPRANIINFDGIS
jgi:hypothetical protein